MEECKAENKTPTITIEWGASGRREERGAKMGREQMRDNTKVTILAGTATNRFTVEVRGPHVPEGLYPLTIG